jgi:hypothetical protein
MLEKTTVDLGHVDHLFILNGGVKKYSQALTKLQDPKLHSVLPREMWNIIRGQITALEPLLAFAPKAISMKKLFKDKQIIAPDSHVIACTSSTTLFVYLFQIDNAEYYIAHTIDGWKIFTHVGNRMTVDTLDVFTSKTPTLFVGQKQKTSSSCIVGALTETLKEGFKNYILSRKELTHTIENAIMN